MNKKLHHWWARTKIFALGGLGVAVLLTVAFALREPTLAVATVSHPTSTGDSLAEAKMLRVPVDAVPAGAITDLRELEEATASRNLSEGAIITDLDIAGSPQTRQLQTGQVLLNLNAPNSVGITNTDHVDIWGADTECYECEPVRLERNVEVANVARINDTESSISIIVEENRAGALLAAQRGGTLQFALRSSIP